MQNQDRPQHVEPVEQSEHSEEDDSVFQMEAEAALRIFALDSSRPKDPGGTNVEASVELAQFSHAK